VNSRSILFILLSTSFMMAAILLRPAPDVGQHDADKASPTELAQTSQEAIEGEGSNVDTGAAEAADSQLAKSANDDASEIQTATAPSNSSAGMAGDAVAQRLTNSQIEQLVEERTPDNAHKNAILTIGPPRTEASSQVSARWIRTATSAIY